MTKGNDFQGLQRPSSMYLEKIATTQTDVSNTLKKSCERDIFAIVIGVYNLFL